MERLRNIKCFLFDMDGTIYLGDSVFPGIPVFFRALRAAGRDYYFVTNNSSRNHAGYAAKLQRMGIPAGEDNVLISSDALIYYLQHEKPGAKLFVLGTPELREEIAAAGFRLLDVQWDVLPDYVVLGFDQSLTYERLAHATRLLDRGIPLLATHPDVRCPMEGGEFLPDAGAMLDLIKTATGVEPQIIFGKPYSYLIDMLMARHGYKKNEIAMVGDRLTTDIPFGLRNGILSVLVLTGEASLADVEATGVRPDVILERTVDIGKYLDGKISLA